MAEEVISVILQATNNLSGEMGEATQSVGELDSALSKLNDREINVGVNNNFDQTRKEVDGLIGTVSKLGQTVGDLAAPTAVFVTAFAPFSTLSRTLIATSQGLGGVSTAARLASGSLIKMVDGFGLLSPATRKVLDITHSLQIMGQAFLDLKQGIDRFKEADGVIAKTAVSIKTTSSFLIDMAGAVANVINPVNVLFTAFNPIFAVGQKLLGLLNPINLLKGAFSVLTKVVSGVSNVLGTVFGAFKSGLQVLSDFVITVRGVVDAVGAVIGVFVDLGETAVAAISKVVNVSADFEVSMGKIQSVSNESAEGMKALRDAALQVGQDTPLAASEAAEALLGLKKAGLESEEAIQALAPAVNAAIASGADLGGVQKTLVSTTNAMGLGFENSEKTLNVLLATTSKTQQSMEGLGHGLTFVAPTAGQLNQSIETLSSAMGVLADQGFEGSRAGAGLNQVLLKLTAPTDAVRAAFNKFGISMQEVNPQTNDLIDILALMEERGVKAADVMGAFGVRAGPQLSALLKAGSTTLRQLRDEITGTNSSAEMMQIQTDNLRQQLISLDGSVERLQISLGTTFQKGLQVVVEETIRVVNEISKFIETSGLATEATKLFTEFGNELVQVFRLFKPVFQPLIDDVQEFANGLKENSAALTLYIRGISDSLQQSEVFNALLRTLKDNMGKVVPALKTAAGAVVGFARALTNLASVDVEGNLKFDFAGAIRLAITTALNVIKTMGKPLTEALGVVLGEVVDWIDRNFGDKIRGAILIGVGLMAANIGIALLASASKLALAQGLVTWAASAVPAFGSALAASGPVGALLTSTFVAKMLLIAQGLGAALLGAGVGIAIGTAIDQLLLATFPSINEFIGKWTNWIAEKLGIAAKAIPEGFRAELEGNKKVMAEGFSNLFGEDVADRIRNSVQRPREVLAEEIRKAFGDDAAAAVESGRLKAAEAIAKYGLEQEGAMTELGQKLFDRLDEINPQLIDRMAGLVTPYGELPAQIAAQAPAVSAATGDVVKPLAEVPAAVGALTPELQKEIDAYVAVLKAKGLDDATINAIKEQALKPYKEVPQEIRQAAPEAKKATDEYLQQLSEPLTTEDKFGGFEAVTRTFNEGIPTAIRGGISKAQGAIQEYNNGIQSEEVEGFGGFATGVKYTFDTEIPEFIRGGISGATGALGELGTALTTVDIQTAMAAKGQEVSFKVAEGIQKAVNKPVAEAIAMGKSVSEAVAIRDAMLARGGEIASAVAQGLKSEAEKAVKEALATGKSIEEALVIRDNILGKGREVTEALAAGMGENAKEPSEIINGIVADVQSNLGKASEGAKEEGGELMEEYASGVVSKRLVVINEMVSLGASIEEALEKTKHITGTISKGVPTVAAEGLRAGKPEVAAAAEEVSGEITEGLKKAEEGAKEAGEGIKEGIVSELEEAKDEAGKIAKEIGETTKKALEDSKAQVAEAGAALAESATTSMAQKATTGMKEVEGAFTGAFGPIEQKFIAAGLELSENYVGQIGPAIKSAVDTESPEWGRSIITQLRNLTPSAAGEGSRLGKEYTSGLGANLSAGLDIVKKQLGIFRDTFTGTQGPLAVDTIKDGAAAVGSTWAKSVAEGISGNKGDIEKALEDIGKLTIGQSPPPEGPLSMLDSAAKGLGGLYIDELTAGMQESINQINSTLGSVAQAASMPLPSAGQRSEFEQTATASMVPSAQAALSGPGGGTNITESVTMPISFGNVTIANGDDEEAFFGKVEEAVGTAARRAGITRRRGARELR